MNSLMAICQKVGLLFVYTLSFLGMAVGATKAKEVETTKVSNPLPVRVRYAATISGRNFGTITAGRKREVLTLHGATFSGKDRTRPNTKVQPRIEKRK